MNQGEIIFLCKGNKKIGSGHVVRCMRLAKALTKKEDNLRERINFLVFGEILKDFKEEIIEDFPLKTIPDNNEALKKEMATRSASTLIVDLLSHEMSSLNPREYKIIALGNYKPGSDIYINIIKDPDFNPKKEYTGYQYWLIEKPETRKSIKNIGKVKNVLMSFGYSDPGKLTQKTLRYITEFYKQNELDEIPIINCVITKEYDLHTEEELKKINKDVVIKKDLEDLEQEILLSDLCIVAGGNTLYESVGLGVPTLVVPYGDANDRLAKEFEKNWYIKKTQVNGTDKAEFQKLYKNLLEKQTRILLYEKCQRFDGHGMSKVIDIIINNS